MGSKLDSILKELESRSDSIRLEAVKKLVEMGTEQACALLRKAVRDENVAVRYYAKKGLQALERKASAERDIIPVVSPGRVAPKDPAACPTIAQAAEIPPALISGPTVKVGGAGGRSFSTGKGSSPESPPARRKRSKPHTTRKMRAELLRRIREHLDESAAPSGAAVEPSAPAAPAAGPAAAPSGAAPSSPEATTASAAFTDTEPEDFDESLYEYPDDKEVPLLEQVAAGILRPCAQLLLELLDYPEEDSCVPAAIALVNLKIPQVRRRFPQLLSFGIVSEALIEAMGVFADGDTIETLIRFYNSDSGEPYRHAVIKALLNAKIDSQRAFDFLSGILENGEQALQATLVRAVGEKADVRFASGLLSKLGGCEEYFELTIVSALSALADKVPVIGGALGEYLPRALNPRKQSTLLSAISNTADPKLVIYVEPYLSDRDRRVRANAVEAIEKLGIPVDKAVSLLLPLLGDKDNRVRANAALSLVRLGEDRAARTLLEMLRSPDKWHRASACFAIGELGIESNARFLVRPLSDPDSDVRINAARALRFIGNEQCSKALIQALADGNHWVRLYALESIAAAGLTGAHEHVQALMKTEKNNQVLAAAFHALVATVIDYDAAVLLVRPFLEHQNEMVRETAIKALEHLLTPDDLSVFAPCLRDLAPNVRAAAVKAIWKFGEFKIAASLYGMLKEGGPEAKKSAAHILGEMGLMLANLAREENIQYLLAALRLHPVYKKGRS